MATYHKDHATAAEVTLETRAAAEARLAESNVVDLLPDVYVDTETFALNVNEQQGTASTTFRAWDSETPFGREASTYTLSGRIPPLGQKMRVGERSLRDAASIRNRIMELARLNGFAMATRSILARAEVLETGKLTVNENRLSYDIDFARPSNHNRTPGALWDSAPAYDILSDLLAWQDIYRTTNKRDANTLVLSSRIMAVLARNESIIAIGAPGVDTGIVSPDVVRAVLGSWGFTSIIVNDELAVDHTNTERRVLSDNKIIFLPGSGSSLSGTGLGETTWGSTTEALNPEYGIGGEVAGAFGAVFHDTDPEGLNVLGQGVALPVLSNARATLVGTVLAAA